MSTKKKNLPKSIQSKPINIPDYKSGVEVIPCGPAADGVTGSCTLVRTSDIQFLIECGLYQKSGGVEEQYKVNNSQFPFDPKEINFVIVGHCHGDHILRIPLLFKRGFRGTVYMPSGSIEIAEILMRDSANIAERDAEEMAHKGYHVLPLYNHEDVDIALDHIEELPMKTEIALNQYVTVKYLPSGHIMNAAQIEISVKTENQTKTIGYTSDLGNIHIRKPFVNKFEPIKKVDMLIGETTYAAADHVATQETRNKDMENLQSIVQEICAERRGKILIPAFANARSQEILVCLYKLFKDDPFFHVPVIYDSPMGSRICAEYLNLLEGEDYDLFWEALNWRNVRIIDSYIDSTAWREDPSPSIVIASSGMLDFGRSKEHAKKIIKNAKNAILFCGFAVDGSLAHMLKEKKDSEFFHINLDKEKITVRCRIYEMLSFSSHMQADSLLNYYSDVECNSILLMHGESEKREEFVPILSQTRKNKGRKGKIYNAVSGHVFKV